MKTFEEHYRFIKQSFDDGEAARVEMSFESHSLDEMLMYMEQFLRGCGFHFDGELKILDSD
jgi:hypothetical protein